MSSCLHLLRQSRNSIIYLPCVHTRFVKFSTMLTRRLASSDAVTQSNLLDYLNLIEERVNKLLLVRQFIAVNDPEAPYVAKSILIGNNLLPPSGPMPTIHAPNLQDDFDESKQFVLVAFFHSSLLHLFGLG